MTAKIDDRHYFKNGVIMESKEGHVHRNWREDLGRCHVPVAGCWCCVCKGFWCGCSCHNEKAS